MPNQAILRIPANWLREALVPGETGVRVTDVCYDFQSNSFLFKLEGPDFPFSPLGERLPEAIANVEIKEGHIVIKSFVLNFDRVKNAAE